MINETYNANKCSHCGQSTTYVLAIDRGTCDILKALSVAIGAKGVNSIHPRKEMEESGRRITYEEMVRRGRLTSNQVGNLTRPRAHGLIASIIGFPGYYCLTSKGAAFLHGKKIPKFAIMDKAKGHQVGYWEPERYQVSIFDFRRDAEYWEGINYFISENRVVPYKPVEPATLPLFTS